MDLPGEILRHIFSYIDSYDIDQKFRLSQVCSQWRIVAVGQRLLWNRTSVMTPLDGNRLPLVLERGGSSVLDIKLLWQYRYKEPMLSADKRTLAALRLRDCRERIQSLFIDIRRSDQPRSLSALLASELEFPVLESLEIRKDVDPNKRLQLRLSAPCLKRLVLSRIDVVRWRKLLVGSLTHLSVKMCNAADLRLLDTILRRCPELTSLTLKQSCFEMGLPELVSRAADCLPHLKVVDLKADVVDLITALRTGFRGLRLDHLSTKMYNGFVDDETKQLMSEVLQGMDLLHSLQVIDDQDIIIKDSADRFRRMEVWNEDGHWQWPDVWQELANQHQARETMKKFRIRSLDWNVLAGAFSACPPLASGIEIHIDLNSDAISDTYNFEHDDYPPAALDKAEVGLRYMRCSALSRVVFGDHAH